MNSEATRSIQGITRSIALVAALVIAAGLAIIIGPGYLNPLRFGPYFIVIGTAGFFAPGVLTLVFALLLRRERRPGPFAATLLGLGWQIAVSLGLFLAQFYVTPISAVPLLLSGLWTLANSILLWRLVRAYGAIGSDADAVRGFAIDATLPTATPLEPTQIDNDREK